MSKKGDEIYLKKYEHYVTSYIMDQLTKNWYDCNILTKLYLMS